MKLIKFKDIFSSPVKPPAIILVRGAAGTMKSALCSSLMLDILQDKNNYGLYITLEQTWESHLENMSSMGLLPPGNLLSLDYNIMRREMGDPENFRVFDSIISILESLKKEKGDALKIFALDSLNAAYSIMNQRIIEYSILPFFRMLKKQNLISLIIFEETEYVRSPYFRERFLADGIISLGIQRRHNDVIRFLKLLKYKAADHTLKRRQLVAGKDGLSLVGPVYT